jgi:hypothetical protein
MSDRELPGSIVEMVHFHDKILLRGNGKAALMTRMETEENATIAATKRLDEVDDRVNKRLDEVDERFDRLDTRITAEVDKVNQAIHTTAVELRKDMRERDAATNKKVERTERLFMGILIAVCLGAISSIFDLHIHI